MKKVNTKILLSGATILFAAAIIIGATFAFFSDTETSQNNVLAAGELDLKIDNTSYYNGLINSGTSWTEKDLVSGDFFFNFNDVKPGDFGEDTISMHIKTNDAWVCTNTTITADDDVSCLEPELADDPTCTDPGVPGNTNQFDGDLADELEIMWWADDGDNVLESDETVIDIGAIGQGPQNVPVSRTIADSTENIFSTSADPLEGGESGPIHYIAKAWCFGNMTPAGLPSSNYSGPDDPENDLADPTGPATSEDGGFVCDASAVVGDAAITDKVMMDVSFYAEQSRNNDDFVCSPQVTPTLTPTITPTLTPTPTPPQISCETPDNIFATTASNNNQGLQKNGSAVLASRSDPSFAFGPPQTTGMSSDSVVTPNSFFSLGFPHANNANTPGNIVYGFAEPFFPNPSGPDLQVYEVTGGVYPDEKVKVEFSTAAGGPWTVATSNPGTRDSGFEMPLSSAQFVRLTESSNIADFDQEADGYDVDAVKALCTQVNPNP